LSEKPNIVFVFADQWRRSATGFAGNPEVRTPHLDRFARGALDFTNAISGCPVCCPARASLLTGAYPHQHGIFVNDVPLGNSHTTLGEAFSEAGWSTAYIGKWHLDGHGRSAPIPPERRKGFQDWWALECSHDYNHSPYYTGLETSPRVWPGYDAEAQTTCALQYLDSRAQSADPFLLVLSWGPPHNPYDSAPEGFRRIYAPSLIQPPPNVPERFLKHARRDLAGYYAHCTALDEQFGRLLAHLTRTGLDQKTIVVFWSDHGDQIHSQGEQRKQRPWEESIHVPLLLRWPDGLGEAGRKVDAILNVPDILPTLMDLAGIDIPSTVSGKASRLICSAGARSRQPGQCSPATTPLANTSAASVGANTGVGARSRTPMSKPSRAPGCSMTTPAIPGRWRISQPIPPPGPCGNPSPQSCGRPSARSAMNSCPGPVISKDGDIRWTSTAPFPTPIEKSKSPPLQNKMPVVLTP